LIVAAYGKAGVEFGPIAEGAKVGGGKNLITGQNVGGLAREQGMNKPGVGASIQGGAEVSLTVKVDKVVNHVVNAVTDALAKIKPQLIN